MTLRGGVYRNRLAAENRDDAYCTGARFAKAAGQAAALDGTKDQSFMTDASGLLTVHMDLSQFTSAHDPEAVGVGDSLEFIFEVRADGYCPELVTVDGSLTRRDAMRSGEDIVTLVSAERAAPFVAAQTVSYTGRAISVRRHTGVIGPSSNYPGRPSREHGHALGRGRRFHGRHRLEFLSAGARRPAFPCRGRRP